MSTMANTAHIPQHTHIQVGDETYINLDYTKIKGAGKIMHKGNKSYVKRIYSWKMAYKAGARKLKCNSVLLEVNTKGNRRVRSSDK